MTDWIIWVAAGLILLIAEMLLPGVFMMWLGLAACGAGLLTLAFQLPFAAQVISFGVLTGITLSIGLRLRRPQQVIHTEREGLIGRPATALVFQGRDGRVRLGDTEWAARVPPDIAPPDPGARLRVAQIDGTIPDRASGFMNNVERHQVDNEDYVLTWTEARQLVQAVEDAFGAADLRAIEQGFTEDAVARFADFPEMRGRPAIMKFLTARFERTLGYKLTKKLQVLTGNRLANTWDASWTDAKTGKSMLGRGTEIWVMHGRRIAVWDATFNVWEKGGAPATPVI